MGQSMKDLNIKEEVVTSTLTSLYQLFINPKPCMMIYQIMRIERIAHETVSLNKYMTT